MGNQIFRKQALASAGQIDNIQRTMRVTRSATRWSTAAVAAVILAIIVWSAFVKVPIHVSGHGLMMQSGGTLITTSPAISSGYLTKLNSHVGDYVKAGQQLAQIQPTDRQQAVDKIERDLSLLKSNIISKQKLLTTDTNSMLANNMQSIKVQEERIAVLTSKRDWLHERQEKLVSLQKKGVVSMDAAADARLAADAAKEALSGARAELVSLTSAAHRIKSTLEQQILQDQLSVAQMEAEYAAAKSTLESDTRILATATGRVMRINARHGALVNAGEPVFEIMPVSKAPLKALVFVSDNQGKQLHRQDKVLLTPANLPHDIHAQLIGTVTSISAVPVSSESIKRTIGDDTLAQQFVSQGPLFEVHVDLMKDDKQQNGYRWTSEKAGSIPLSPGTPLSARVTVEQTPLLALALPAVKRFLGEPSDALEAR